MLQKQPVSINFADSMDTKTDPYQLPIGKFAYLTNKVYNKFGRLDKRNGFKELASLPDSTNQFVTTFNGGLIATGEDLFSYSSSSMAWTDQGSVTHAALETQSLIRTSTSQTSCDAAVSSNNLVCTVYTDAIPGGTVYRYAIAEVGTGQNLIEPTNLASATGAPRVFVLGNYFVIVYPVSAALKYLAVSIYDPTSTVGPTNLSTVYDPASLNRAFNGVVVNNRLFVAYNATDVGGALRLTYLTSTLSQGGTNVYPTGTYEYISLAADESASPANIYVFHSEGAGAVYLVVDFNLNDVLTTTTIDASTDILNITGSVSDGAGYVFYEVDNDYSYGATLPTHYIASHTVDVAGTVGTQTVVIRSLGLASESFIANDNTYFLAAYDSDTQPSFFLVRQDGYVIGKLAYSTGAGYSTTGLPHISTNEDEDTFYHAYLLNTRLVPVNKNFNDSVSNITVGSYAQVGINLASWTFDSARTITSEIGKNLHLSGGLLWTFDGYSVAEQGFNLWPDDVECTWSATGGSIAAQPDGSTNTNAYYYVAVYEYTDNQGNIIRSAPSIPVAVTTTGTGTVGSITVNVPYLRVTNKTSPIKVTIYRWSVANQVFYEVTSITSPTLNSKTSDSVAYVDTQADASIIGNSILYTTGGVIENIGAPPTRASTLFKSRLFLIDSENDNRLWFSKQVIENTPVELSDLFTLFVAPTTGAQGDTGKLKCLSPMDDKLILFKDNALYYLVGNGPDNVGTNNDFSEPVFITSTVGSNNQKSIVFQPQGLMFESDKGIWLLGRDLSTSYIGAPVESYTQSGSVLSAVTVPETNQVRFVLSSGVTLMFDYYFNQWSVFQGVTGISSTIFKNLHTYIDQYGRVFQETPGQYLDGSRPVLIGFKTGWINVAGLQGYERAYFLYLLGEFKSPHRLLVEIAYDYDPSPIQSTYIDPINYNASYGDEDGDYGDGSPYGGVASAEKWRVFFKKQKCEAFQLTITEIYDGSYGVSPGEGLTLSGMNLVVGIKKGYRTQSARTSTG